MSLPLDRRSFISAAGAAVAASSFNVARAAAPEKRAKQANKICAFMKFLQPLSYDELADSLAELGFDGVEATVRTKGYILPEHAADKLPRFVEALRKRGLEVTILTSSIARADEPYTESVLKTAASLGIERYRLGSHHYDMSRPVTDQLNELQPVFDDLVDMSREIGIQPMYQNHSGSANVGAALWDVYSLMRHHAPDDFAFAFDIRHATVEGGLCWPVHFNLAEQRLGAVYAKDFVWKGRSAENVPLGTGQVNPRFFTTLAKSGYTGPISVHVEYDESEPVAHHLKLFKQDLATLKRLLAG